jgi:rod shape-determining protein MreD
MIYLLWALIILFTFVAQRSISLLGITPDFTILLVCYMGVKKGEIKGMFFGALIGALEDSLSGAFLGPNLLSKGLLGYLSAILYSRFFIWTPLLGVVSTSVLTLADGFMVFTFRSIFDRMPGSLRAVFLIVALQALLNAPFGFIIKPGNLQQSTLVKGK